MHLYANSCCDVYFCHDGLGYGNIPSLFDEWGNCDGKRKRRFFSVYIYMDPVGRTGQYGFRVRSRKLYGDCCGCRGMYGYADFCDQFFIGYSSNDDVHSYDLRKQYRIGDGIRQRRNVPLYVLLVAIRRERSDCKQSGSGDVHGYHYRCSRLYANGNRSHQ